MSDPDLEFKNGNPGAVKYGNFINYYKFHPPEERIKLLPNDIWTIFDKETKFAALDVGCNAGDLTVSLLELLKRKVKTPKMLAVDIDPILIERANSFNNPDITFQCLDIMDRSKSNDILTDYLSGENLTKFSLIFSFSTTMWIHLNHGDDGLRTFLKYLSELSDVLILEPQPWKCYKTAVKRMKNSYVFPAFSSLKFREKVDENIVEYLRMQCDMEVIGESDRTSWERRILIFKKNN